MSMIGNFAGLAPASVAPLLANPEMIPSVLYGEEEGTSAVSLTSTLDVDKAWHAIHFLLCGQAWEGDMPLGFIVAGGQSVGDVDVGYGPARVFTPSEVRAIDDALAPISRADLMGRWRPEDFVDEDIYGVDPENPNDEDRYVGAYFEELKAFVAQLAREGNALIVYIN